MCHDPLLCAVSARLLIRVAEPVRGFAVTINRIVCRAKDSIASLDWLVTRGLCLNYDPAASFKVMIHLQTNNTLVGVAAGNAGLERNWPPYHFPVKWREVKVLTERDVVGRVQVSTAEHRTRSAFSGIRVGHEVPDKPPQTGETGHKNQRCQNQRFLGNHDSPPCATGHKPSFERTRLIPYSYYTTFYDTLSITKTAPSRGCFILDILSYLLHLGENVEI